MRKPLTPAQQAARRQWYADHAKRLGDAKAAYRGYSDPTFHADGVHRLTERPFLEGEDAE